MSKEGLKAPQGRPSRPVGRPKSSFDPSAFTEHLQHVPLEERQRMAADILGREIATYDDLIKFNQFLVAEMVGGNLGPELAREARGFAEQIFTNIAAKGHSAAASNVADSLRELAEAQRATTSARREIVASYTVLDATEVTVPEVAVLPLERKA